jgi:tetratricopeptide (TPR) repeat protein
MLTRVAQEELIDVPWMEPVRKALLEDALQFYEQLLAKRTADPEIRLASAQAWLLSGWISGRSGDDAGHRKAIRRALDLLEPLNEEFPESVPCRAALATALHYQSHETAWTPNRYQEAEKLLRRAVQLQESVVAATPESSGNAYDLANMLHLLGNALRTGGRHEEAETVYLRVVSIGEGGTAKDPNDPAHLRAQIRGLTCIAEMICGAQPERAEALLVRAQTLATRFQAARRKTGTLFDTASATVADVDKAFVTLYRQTKRFKEALAASRRAHAINAKYASDFPSFRYYRDRVAWSTESLARSLSDLAEHDQAERAWREVIEIFDKLAADFPKTSVYRSGLGRSYRSLAATLDATNRPDDAAKALRQSLEQFLKIAEDDPDGINANGRIGNPRIEAARVSRQLAMRTQRTEDAEPLYRHAVTLLESVVGERPDVAEYRSTLGDTHGRLATLLGDAGRIKEAEAAVRQAVAVFEKLAAEFPKQRAYRETLATTYAWRWVKIATAAGRPDEVDKAKRQALTIWEKLAADFPEEAQYPHKAGVLQQGLGAYDAALTSLTKAVDLQPDSWESWHLRGNSFAKLGQWEKAVADQTRAVELKPDYWQAYHNRGLSLGKLGQWDKVIADQTKALELNPKHWWSLSRRGDAYSALKQWDKALSDYTKAIELGSTESYVWVAKAGMHARLNQPDQAMAELRRAVAKGYQDVKQLKNRSDLADLRSRDDFKQLVGELEAKKK